MADVHVLPGIERRDITGPPRTPAQIIQTVVDQGVTDLVIVGRARTGEIYVNSCTNDLDKAAGLLMGGATFLATHVFRQGIVETQT